MNTLLLIIGGAGVSSAILSIFFGQRIVRSAVTNYYISRSDFSQIKRTADESGSEHGWALKIRPNNRYVKVRYTGSGKIYGDKPGIKINQKGDEQSTIHSHMDSKDLYRQLNRDIPPQTVLEAIDEYNSVPSEYDIATMKVNGNKMDFTQIPSDRLVQYGFTQESPKKMGWKRFDPTGLVVFYSLKRDLSRIQNQHMYDKDGNVKLTKEDAVKTNRAWVKVLDEKYGIKVVPLKETKKGVKIENFDN